MNTDAMMAALQEADTIMGHDDAATEWREKWGHLWAPGQTLAVADAWPVGDADTDYDDPDDFEAA